MDQATAKASFGMELAAENNTFDLSADAAPHEFDPEEDTDLNDDELDEDIPRKMSIRALNVGMMHKFSPGKVITNYNTSSGAVA